uniref:Myosin motor domain-containing protein n=1 Tax=Anopheles coluzzii TaxID=1518534 RepID=A0A8W7PP28_ANOCL
MDWSTGDLVWFDPGLGHPLPGEIQEVHRAAQMIIVQALINGKVGSFQTRASLTIQHSNNSWLGWNTYLGSRFRSASAPVRFWMRTVSFHLEPWQRGGTPSPSQSLSLLPQRIKRRQRRMETVSELSPSEGKESFVRQQPARIRRPPRNKLLPDDVPPNPQTFTLGPNEGNIRARQDLGKTGVEDMTQLEDLHEASLLWNLKLRYDNGLIYTNAGSILIAINPYKIAMQVLGVTESEREGIVKVLASVLHLGNVYFHRRQLRHGQEGVEIGSDAEIKWAAHLLQLPSEGILKSLTSRITETRSERLYTPLGIDQALDARDALAKALYSGLFNWLVLRINSIVHRGGTHDAQRLSILDIFGFEDLAENSFEQLCINYANESLQLYFNKHVFKLEQAEYARERLEWTNLEWEDNLPVIHLLAKKPTNPCRLFPPAWLEWRASSRLADTALGLNLPDNSVQTVAVDSWTTCEEAAALAISSFGIPNLGWTVVIDESDQMTDSCGLDFVLDLVAEKELPPAFPAVRSDILRCGRKGGAPSAAPGAHDSAAEPSSPKRPQVPPPEPPSMKRSSHEIQLVPVAIGSGTKKHEPAEYGGGGGAASRHHMEPSSAGRKTSHDVSLSRHKLREERAFYEDKSRSRSLDDLLAGEADDALLAPDADEPETSLTLTLAENRIGNKYRSVDTIAPLKEQHPRFVKSQYAGKRSSGSHSLKYAEKSEFSVRSSAMSDTSEAPSLASHVRRVRVPSQASDVDQFLDDLFSPVLDGSLDELSDARSLAASIRGGAQFVSELLATVRTDRSLTDLEQSAVLASATQGGTTHQAKNATSNGFTPSAPNPIAPLSPPVSSSGSLLMMGSVSPDVVMPVFTIPPGVDSTAYQQQMQRAFLQSAMAQNIQIQQQLMAQNQALQTLLTQQDGAGPSSSSSPANPGAASPKHGGATGSPTSVQHSPIRKMSAKAGGRNDSTDRPIGPPATSTSFSDMLRNRKDSSSSNLIPPPPPPPLPPPLELKDPFEVRPFLDPYGRAKTVRIGKWRWPPPQGVTASTETEETFIQFKMTRQSNRKTTPQSQHSSSNLDSPIGSPNGVEWEEFEIDQKLQEQAAREADAGGKGAGGGGQQPGGAARMAKRSFDIGADRPAPNSVGKLKLSNEMRQRLEQVTAGHSVRSSSAKSERPERTPAKLEDTRRMMLEQQLGGMNPPERAQQNQSEIPSFVQRQERDTFGAKDSFMDSWGRAEAAKLDLVYETSFKKEMIIERERSRSRSRSRDRENFSESVWDRSEVEGPSSTSSDPRDRDRGDKEREARERNYELTQLQREKESNKVFHPSSYTKDKQQQQHHQQHHQQHQQQQQQQSQYQQQYQQQQKQYSANAPGSGIATFKTHMVQKSVQERERKSSAATTNGSVYSEKLDDGAMADPPAPVLPVQMNPSLKAPAAACLTYNRVTWTLRVRKEVFRPSETVTAPAALDLLFNQITADVFGVTPCMRISPQEKRLAVNLLSSHGITANGHSTAKQHVRAIVKRHVLDMARGWPLYFARLFVMNGSPSIQEGTLLAVSHMGVYLASKEPEFLSIQRAIPFDDIQSVTTLPRPLTLQLTLKTGARLVMHASKANAIQVMVQSYLAEYRQMEKIVSVGKQKRTKISEETCEKEHHQILMENSASAKQSKEMSL